jgi:hypothetical protein
MLVVVGFVEAFGQWLRVGEGGRRCRATASSLVAHQPISECGPLA